MPTSTAIQSRIAALQASAAQPTPRRPSPPPQPPSSSKTALFDLSDWVLDDMPSPPPNLRIPPVPKPKPLALQAKPSSGQTKTPALPPRRTTQDSDSSLLYPPLGGVEANQNGGKGNHVQASSVSSFHSVSLSDTDSAASGFVTNTLPVDKVPSSPSLTESFEEVSIPQPPPPLPQRPSSIPTASLSSQKSAQPALPVPTLLPYVPRRVPPPPPSRASDRSSIQSSTSSSQSRRSSGSVQTPTLLTALPLSPSSILSPTTTKPKRPTPVPLAAQKRYEAVFNANIIQRRRVAAIKEKEPPRLVYAEAKRTRQAAGWRGLSVDLITAPPEEIQNVKGKNKEQGSLQVDETVGPNDRLEGSITKSIWSRSGIERRKLVEIWNECDVDNQGSLDLESFIRGMWRIDEQLRRSQTHTYALRSAHSSNSSLRNGYDSLRIKPKLSDSLHRNSSRSSFNGHGINGHAVTNVYTDYRPPPVPKLILH